MLDSEFSRNSTETILITEKILDLTTSGDAAINDAPYSGAVRGGPRLQLLFEPGACQLRDLFQRSRLLKEMRSSGYVFDLSRK